MPKTFDRSSVDGQGHHYLIGIGSNMRHPRHGPPASVVRASIDRLDSGDVVIEASSRIVASDPLGPSMRRYANAACIVQTGLAPVAMLAALNRIEREFGRQRKGRRWRQRTLDLDIVLWSGGVFASDRLLIPHREFRQREFVLGPAARIAPDWRDPITGLSLQQLHARLTRPRPLPR